MSRRSKKIHPRIIVPYVIGVSMIALSGLAFRFPTTPTARHFAAFTLVLVACFCSVAAARRQRRPRVAAIRPEGPPSLTKVLFNADPELSAWREAMHPSPHR